MCRLEKCDLQYRRAVDVSDLREDRECREDDQMDTDKFEFSTYEEEKRKRRKKTYNFLKIGRDLSRAGEGICIWKLNLM
jgi:hypothetical protein